MATLWCLSGWTRSLSPCSPHLHRQTSHTLHRDGLGMGQGSLQCPDAVVLYNQYMAGVDKGDQCRQYYRIRIKCVKYYKYLFWFAIDASITNSFILSLFSSTTMSITHQRQKSFRLTLAEKLVGSYNSRKQLGYPQYSLAHAPLTMPSPSTSSCCTPLHLPSCLQGRRRCAYCAECRQPLRRHDVLWCCKACTFEPPLCLTGTEDGQIASPSGITIYCKHWFTLALLPFISCNADTTTSLPLTLLHLVYPPLLAHSPSPTLTLQGSPWVRPLPHTTPYPGT